MTILLKQLQIRDNCAEVAEVMRRHPAWINRARKSALSSVANSLREKIRAQYLNKAGWPATKTAQGTKGKGMEWWARFVRYRIMAGRRMVLMPLKDQWRGSGEDRTYARMPVDRGLVGIIRKHEEGRTIRVTKKMRAKMAAKGMTLRKTTRTIRVPQRSAFHKIFDQEAGNIPVLFQRKFLENFRRYESGLSKMEWDLLRDEGLL